MIPVYEQKWPKVTLCQEAARVYCTGLEIAIFHDYEYIDGE
jgi:hypothetical protein